MADEYLSRLEHQLRPHSKHSIAQHTTTQHVDALHCLCNPRQFLPRNQLVASSQLSCSAHCTAPSAAWCWEAPSIQVSGDVPTVVAGRHVQEQQMLFLLITFPTSVLSHCLPYISCFPPPFSLPSLPPPPQPQLKSVQPWLPSTSAAAILLLPSPTSPLCYAACRG